MSDQAAKITQMCKKCKNGYHDDCPKLGYKWCDCPCHSPPEETLKDKMLNHDNLAEAARLSIQDQRKVTEESTLKQETKKLLSKIGVVITEAYNSGETCVDIAQFQNDFIQLIQERELLARIDELEQILEVGEGKTWDIQMTRAVGQVAKRYKELKRNYEIN